MINKQLTHVQKADSAVYETPSWLGRHIFGLLLAPLQGQSRLGHWGRLIDDGRYDSTNRLDHCYQLLSDLAWLVTACR